MLLFIMVCRVLMSNMNRNLVLYMLVNISCQNIFLSVGYDKVDSHKRLDSSYLNFQLKKKKKIFRAKLIIILSIKKLVIDV